MNSVSPSHKKILVLPRWSPNRFAIQLGLFIQRQLLLLTDEFDFFVVYAQALPKLEQKFEKVTSNVNGFTENIVYFRSARGPFRKITNFLRYRKAQKIGLSEIPKSVDGCHIHVPYRSALPAIRLKKEASIPYLITEHWSGHLNGQYQRKNFIDKWLYKKIISQAAAISTVSQALQKSFQTNTGFSSVVIPNYIERAAVHATNVNKETIHLLSVGDIHDKTKNFSGLIAAFEAAHTQNQRLTLTIVGDGPDRAKIEAIKNNSKVPASSIIFKGRLPHHQVLKSIAACDFYICNSNYETFGMTVAEALYAGKPVICTHCGGPEEFMTSENGLLVEPGDENQLTSAILQMANQFKSYNSSQLIIPIENRFGEAVVKNAWKQFYNEHLK